jgi:glycosyltransferase involved in cell wall biosynthesis
MAGKEAPVPPSMAIVVINHNYDCYLASAIGSALAQTHPAAEVIVVDDGSIDESRDVIAGFADRVRAVLQKNRGGTEATNAGFAVSTSEVVLFLDADDALHPDALKEIAARWRSGLAKAQFQLAMVDESGRALGGLVPNSPTELSSEELRRRFLATALYPWPPTSGNAYHRSYLEKMMPLGSLFSPNSSDSLLNVVAPLYGDILFIRKVLGYYRLHGRNISNPLAAAPARLLRETRLLADALNHLEAHAKRLGVALAPDIREHITLLERRLTLTRVGGERFHPADRPLPLLWAAARKLALSEGPLARHAAHLLWLTAVAILPKPLARRLVELRFIVPGRPAPIMRVLRGLGILQPDEFTPGTQLIKR